MHRAWRNRTSIEDRLGADLATTRYLISQLIAIHQAARLMSASPLPHTEMGGFRHPPRSSPHVTLAHPSHIENTFARRMVLASRFRGGMLRLPLFGMVYCDIATGTLEGVRVLLISKRGRREEKSRGWKRQSLVSRPQNHEPSHAVKILRQLLTFVKGIGPFIERTNFSVNDCSDVRQ